MSLTYTYDPSSVTGQVRLKIGDANDTEDATLSGPRDEWPCILADEEIQVALNNKGGSVLLAAIDLLLAMAVSAAHVAAAIKVGNFSRDPSKIPGIMRDMATALRQEDENTPLEGVFTTIDDQYQMREYLARGYGYYLDL